ncbi:hypothetical protein RLIN73S_02192 [Rhodanobacter lindaniclasticus]
MNSPLVAPFALLAMAGGAGGKALLQGVGNRGMLGGAAGGAAAQGKEDSVAGRQWRRRTDRDDPLVLVFIRRLWLATVTPEPSRRSPGPRGRRRAVDTGGLAWTRPAVHLALVTALLAVPALAAEVAPPEVTYASIEQLQQRMDAGTLDSRQLTQASLERIQRMGTAGPTLRAVMNPDALDWPAHSTQNARRRMARCTASRCC